MQRRKWLEWCADRDRRRRARLAPSPRVGRPMLATDLLPVSSRTPTSSITVVAAASFVGTAIEWYDFFLYGTSAVLVFPKLFFPASDPVVGTLLALATFAAGFLARPLGGIVFGHYGDRLGRKAMLSVTLWIMGVATFAIGVLPTYASIGIAAPILLVTLRLLQGFGLGGEWGGAVLLAAEHAPAARWSRTACSSCRASSRALPSSPSGPGGSRSCSACCSSASARSSGFAS